MFRFKHPSFLNAFFTVSTGNAKRYALPKGKESQKTILLCTVEKIEYW